MKSNPGLPRQNQHSVRKKLFTSKLDLHLKKKLVKCYILSTAMCDAETRKLRKVDQKYLEGVKYGAGEGWRRSTTPIVKK
jgi:hypothetical protein